MQAGLMVGVSALAVKRLSYNLFMRPMEEGLDAKLKYAVHEQLYNNRAYF